MAPGQSVSGTENENNGCDWLDGEWLILYIVSYSWSDFNLWLYTQDQMNDSPWLPSSMPQVQQNNMKMQKKFILFQYNGNAMLSLFPTQIQS